MASALRSRLSTLASTVSKSLQPAVETAKTKAATQYEKVMANNAQYVVKDPAEADKLFKQLVYTNLAKIPVGIKHMQQEAQVVKDKLSKAGTLDLTEVGMYALFTAEVYAWFCIGEIIGRGGTISGYKI